MSTNPGLLHWRLGDQKATLYYQHNVEQSTIFCSTNLVCHCCGSVYQHQEAVWCNNMKTRICPTVNEIWLLSWVNSFLQGWFTRSAFDRCICGGQFQFQKIFFRCWQRKKIFSFSTPQLTTNTCTSFQDLHVYVYLLWLASHCWLADEAKNLPFEPLRSTPSPSLRMTSK